MWSTLLQVGGDHIFLYFRSEFIRAWNDTAKTLKLDHLVYKR
jgi:hypothetical protein